MLLSRGLSLKTSTDLVLGQRCGGIFLLFWVVFFKVIASKGDAFPSVL